MRILSGSPEDGVIWSTDDHRMWTGDGKREIGVDVRVEELGPGAKILIEAMQVAGAVRDTCHDPEERNRFGL